MATTTIDSHITRVLTAAVGTILGITAISASAQPQDRRAISIEEVIVTARKVEESLQDTPVAVSAFSTGDLEQLGVSEAGDVAKYAPGLVMRKQSASQDNYGVSIRGVSSAETALAIDPTVGIYQDGVYIARSTGAAFDIVDLERIEVLRGPQGTLFGRNTIGGAINIITQKPRGEYAFYQSASYGDEGYDRFKTTLDTPSFLDNTAALKLSFLRNTRDGEVESFYTGGQLGQSENVASRLAFNWTPVETFTADIVYDKVDRESNAGADQLTHVRPLHIALGGPYYATAATFSDEDRLSKLPKPNDNSDETSSDIDGTSLTMEWELTPNLSLKSISSYREWKSRARGTDFSSIPADGMTLIDFRSGSPTFGAPVPAGTLVPIFGASRESAQRQTTQEFQLTGSALNDRINYIAGLYYFEEQADEKNPQSFVLPGPFTGFLPAGTSALISRPFFAYATDNTSYAAFGQLTYTVLRDFDITFALRYTVDEKETTLTNNLKQQPADASSSATLQTVTDDNDWNKLSPSITFDYRWNEQLSTYFKVATGYRSGGYNVRADSVSTFREPFDEEDLVSYELGFKSDLFNRRLRLNGTIYHMEYEDRQIAQFAAGSGGASTEIVNAGESTSSGVELEGMFIVVPGLRLIASYSYLDLEYDEFITGDVNPVTGLPTGTNRDIADEASENLYAPEQSGALAVEYQFAPWSIGQLTLRVDGTYTDSISFHPQFDLFNNSEAHSLVNARATLADIPLENGKLKLAAWGKNLGDTEYRQFGIDFGTLGFTINDFGYLRSWGLDIVYEYNR